MRHAVLAAIAAALVLSSCGQVAGENDDAVASASSDMTSLDEDAVPTDLRYAPPPYPYEYAPRTRTRSAYTYLVKPIPGYTEKKKLVCICKAPYDLITFDLRPRSNKPFDLEDFDLRPREPDILKAKENELQREDCIAFAETIGEISGLAAGVVVQLPVSPKLLAAAAAAPREIMLLEGLVLGSFAAAGSYIGHTIGLRVCKDPRSSGPMYYCPQCPGCPNDRCPCPDPCCPPYCPPECPHTPGCGCPEGGICKESAL